MLAAANPQLGLGRSAISPLTARSSRFLSSISIHVALMLYHAQFGSTIPLPEMSRARSASVAALTTALASESSMSARVDTTILD